MSFSAVFNLKSFYLELLDWGDLRICLLVAFVGAYLYVSECAWDLLGLSVGETRFHVD